jgi:hypothetical protein
MRGAVGDALAAWITPLGPPLPDSPSRGLTNKPQGDEPQGEL